MEHMASHLASNADAAQCEQLRARARDLKQMAEIVRELAMRRIPTPTDASS